MSIRDDLAIVEKHLSEGAHIAGDFMLELVRRARAELGSIERDVEAEFDPPVVPPATEAPIVELPVTEPPVDPSTALAPPLADAEPLTDLHGEPVPTINAPVAGAASTRIIAAPRPWLGITLTSKPASRTWAGW